MSWVNDETNKPNGVATMLQPLLEVLLQRVMDKNKKVQEYACSCFAVLCEEVSDRQTGTSPLVPFLQPILQQLMFAYQK